MTIVADAVAALKRKEIKATLAGGIRKPTLAVLCFRCIIKGTLGTVPY